MAISLQFIPLHEEPLFQFLRAHLFSDDLLKKYRQSPFAFQHNHVLQFNDTVTSQVPLEIVLPDEISHVNRIEGDLQIIYEDDYLLVVDKPSQLATLGTGVHYQRHLAGMVANYYAKNHIASKIHFVNRLDYETSGLIMLAKHQYIHGLFATKNYSMTKKYIALCQGHLEQTTGMIDFPIKKAGEKTTKRMVASDGQVARTSYRVVRYIGENSLVELTLHTGRTHQIRVHMAAINHPLIGDTLYNDNPRGSFYLQSAYLGFVHPITNKEQTFELPNGFSS